MSRWRPPQPKSSAYITAAGHRLLKTELNYLWRELRPSVVKALSEAAAEGDRSENAEYIYRKKQLGEIDRRLRYLSKRVDEVQPVSGLPADPGKVFFGATVTVEDVSDSAADQQISYQIVGADEIDAKTNRISIDSPLARALLGKALDDEVQVDTPSGLRELVILAIDYDQINQGAD
ncbi:MAG: transcription elongation factor GreB [Pseudomonadota bacterium]